MSQKNGGVVCMSVFGSMRGRAGAVAVVLVALACGFSAVGTAGAAAGPFREVAVVNDVLSLQSDGVRYAWVTYSRSGVGEGPGVVVFDTERGGSFQLAEPAPGCGFVSAGGGLALWAWCDLPSPSVLVSDLSTGQSRAPAGIDGLPWWPCGPDSIGRYWLAVSCGGGKGSGPFYLNHRTGRVTDEIDPYSPDLPFIDLDYVALFRRLCAPLERPSDGAHVPYFDYAPPFALHALGTAYHQIRLRRCGTKRAEVLSLCGLECRTPQLGSRYVTWGEYKRVYAYLPRIRRRVLVGRLSADFNLQVAHTCNQVFARRRERIYVARFEPRRGAPPCQTRSRPRNSTAVP